MYPRVLIFLLTIFLSSIVSASPGVTPVRVAAAQVAEFFEKYTAFGQVNSDRASTYVVNVASGKVDSIKAVEGQRVKAGDIIVAIDSDIAESIKAKATVAFSAAELEYKRTKSLFDKKITSEEVLENARVSLETARAELAKTKSTYDDMVVSADFDGKVGVVMVNVGDTVKSGDYLFSLIDGSRKHMILSLPSTLYSKVNTSTEIFFNNNEGHPAEGKIVAVSPYISNSGTVNIRAEIVKGDSFVHGSYLNADLIINKHKALGIPEQAVLKNDKGSFVYVVGENSTINQRYVTLGIRTNKMIEVISDNLKEGDRVIVEGLTKIFDGAAVQIMEQ